MKGSIVNRNLAAATALTAVALLALVAPGMSQAPSGSGPAKKTDKPFVIGHRGAAGLLPENTLAAFKRACEIGVDAVELDVLVSADGEMVVHHDFKLKPETARSADGAWVTSGSQPAVKDLTLAQLKTYDVGRLQPKTPMQHDSLSKPRLTASASRRSRKRSPSSKNRAAPPPGFSWKSRPRRRSLSWHCRRKRCRTES